MYIEPDLRDRVYQLFSLEVPKMLQTIETELVTLSIDRSAKKVNALLRAAHSIKGGAASLGLEAISDLAHQVEDIFRVLNHPELPFDRNLELLLFQLYDGLERLVTAEINGTTLAAEFSTQIQIILADLDDEIGHFVIAGQQLPADRLSSGVDLTQSIFEVDVAQSLARLERVLLDPECDAIVVGEFRAQAEVFTGIATLTDTPGFGAIAHATISALDRHPDRAREICCFALVDFYKTLDAVLIADSAGERLRQRADCKTISPGFAFLIAEPPRATQPNVTMSALETLLDEPPSLAVDSFDLEEIFDRIDEEFDLIFDPEDRQWYAGHLGVEIIADLAETIDAIDRHIQPLDKFAPILSEAAEGEFATIVADRSTSHATLESIDRLNLSFDLVDIFDLPPSAAASYATVETLPIPTQTFDPELDEAVDLNFDLVDIFDLPAIPDLLPIAHRAEIGLLVAEITNNFDRLPPIEPSTFTATSKILKPRRVKKARKVIPATAPQLSIRVALDRLERMNNLMGEIAIERHGLALYNEQCQETLGLLRSKCENFHTIGDRLRQIADTLVISTQLPPATAAAQSELRLDLALSQQFDALELDRYSELHDISQATIEQIAQIEEQIEDLSLFGDRSYRQIDRQKQLLSYLRDELMWARMLPLGEILNRFPRTLHDLSIEFNKPVDLKITGAGVLVDRVAIDKLLDPLVHLLRNAFDHGIDSAATRQVMGKPERGTIEITAYHQGSQTVIEIADDGRGIDLDAIAAKGIALNLLTEAEARQASEERLLDLLFTPGFSTAERVTKLSGRGMGLDIVKEQIQAIKGTIEIESQVGIGTTFILRIPLTLTIAQLMVCQVGNAVYAFPADSIQKIVIPLPEQLTQNDSGQIFHWRNLTIPIYHLIELLPYSVPISERTISHTLKSSASNPPDWLPPLLLIRRGDRLVGLQIDRLITEQELTIVPFGKAIRPPSYSYGCTILGDGVILPVLDPHTIVQVLVERPRCPVLPNLPPPVSIASRAILVIDDSVTTRQSLCLSLEKYGYRTFQAKDGQEGLELLRQKTSEIKLVVCDVEMPNLNGFEFLNIYRQDPALTSIPVVMLTSRSNNKHRQFATHLGAVDYFIKPYLEQDFMMAIEKIIDERDLKI
ncbi:hybrid sensor histidine kinase/response regulator [Chamaesiphon minutus]|uniref:histidine kinase n=1 Tax=Chamaesiphon minutus (strain ATCC 27169 / PCC 6605) TaxID=1173020 RepID=K9UKC5_CHAP6|nr:hybrid sensor histidine kinase/response regulator [Chamaesiphon minutus]AFY94654.1 chemotaxis protein histidine kinase-like protein [Chamaesiphon minutus PCC 6605]